MGLKNIMIGLYFVFMIVLFLVNIVGFNLIVYGMLIVKGCFFGLIVRKGLN